MTKNISNDLEYRPSTYWPEAENREQRLSRIQGKARRDITRKALEEGGIEALNAIAVRRSRTKPCQNKIVRHGVRYTHR